MNGFWAFIYGEVNDSTSVLFKTNYSGIFVLEQKKYEKKKKIQHGSIF